MRRAESSKPCHQRNHTVVGSEIDFEFSQAIVVSLDQRCLRNVRHEDGSFELARSATQERIVEMNSVDDETGAEAILRELFEQIVRELRQQFMGGVTEVRGERCASVDRGRDLFRIRPCVANADRNSGLR